MPSKELIAELGEVLFQAEYGGDAGKTCYLKNHHERLAQAAISTILAALQEDRYLHEIIERHFNMPHGRGYGKDRLSVFLAASALGEQSE